MKLKIDRYCIRLIPEYETEIAYIEEVLRLRKDGDWCKLIRHNAMGLNCVAWLKTESREEEGA